MTDTLTLPTAPPAAPIVDPREERAAKVSEAFRVLARVGDELGVANFLKELGIRGNPTSSDSCPVALYIFAVTGIRIVVNDHRWWVMDGVEPGVVPHCVGAFIHDFDGGAFPELQSRGRWLPGLPPR